MHFSFRLHVKRIWCAPVMRNSFFHKDIYEQDYFENVKKIIG
jgi:hypothetical protein